MLKFLLLSFLVMSVRAHSQTDTTKWLRAFPITDYIVSLNDTVKVVQVEMPDGLTIKQEQLGLLYGVYATSAADAVEKGYGKCYLIKGDYFYFPIRNNKSGKEIKKGDLIYAFMDKTAIHYGQIPQLAAHFIRLLNVYDSALYDRYIIFNQWTEREEQQLVDSMVADIQFTGTYFLQNNPDMDVVIKTGDYKGRSTLKTMIACKPADVRDFLDYIIARPRNYAGREWKISEIFATWLAEGAPKVLKK
jgi:hypothetical protein